MTIVLRADDDSLSNNEVDSNFNSVARRYGDTIASAGTLNFTDEFSYFNVSGTTTITDFPNKVYSGSKYGFMVTLVFDGILILTHDVAKLFLPNAGSNITTAANDVGVFVQETAAIWKCIAYARADGSSLDSSANLTVTGNLSVAGNAHFGTKETATIGGGNVTIDFSAGNKQFLSLDETLTTGDVTLTAPGGSASLLLQVTNTGTFNIDSDAWPAAVLWPSNVAPNITDNGKDVISFYWDGTNYFGSVLQDFS